MELSLPKKFECLLNERAQYKVFHGGRGGAKSRSIGTALNHLTNTLPLRVLCTRETQRSIKHSSKKLLEDDIKRQGLESKYHTTREGIYHENGSEYIFEGLWNNVENIKSVEDIDIVWIEEAQMISQISIDKLFPTIRKKNSEIWISYNELLDDTPIHKMFVVNEPPPNSIVTKVNYNDNPWFPDELRSQMEWCKETDYDKYRHIWLGETLQHSEEQVYFSKWEVGSVPTPPKDTVFYHGVDWGFSTDPMAALRCWEDEENSILYIDRESGGLRIENDDIIKVIENKIETFRYWPSYADNARPETISHVKNKGFSKIKACSKWKGCVEDGISFIRSYKKIIVSSDCEETIKEFGNYKYKKDKSTGDILPIIVDKDNHYMDALRYALGQKIKKRPDKNNAVSMPSGHKIAVGY